MCWSEERAIWKDLGFNADDPGDWAAMSAALQDSDVARLFD